MKEYKRLKLLNRQMVGTMVQSSSPMFSIQSRPLPARTPKKNGLELKLQCLSLLSDNPNERRAIRYTFEVQMRQRPIVFIVLEPYLTFLFLLIYTHSFIPILYKDLEKLLFS